MIIRKTTIKDAEAITGLSDQLGYKATAEQTWQRLFEILGHDDYCVYVAVEGDTITGWIQGFYSMRVESSDFVEISGLVVDKNHQRKGIGKLLVNEVIKWAKEKNCYNLRVRCQTFRKEAHHFYESLGFVETKEQKVFGKVLGHKL